MTDSSLGVTEPSSSLRRTIRYGFILSGTLLLIMAVGFFFQAAWADALWPWETSRLSNIFISSILAASSIPILWIALAGELAATTGGAIDLGVMFAGMALFSYQVYARSGQRSILFFAIFSTAMAVVCVMLFLWARRLAFRNTRPLPRLVHVSFAIFSVLLILVGIALLLVMPNILPWPLTPEQSVLYGWIFLGAAFYFLYAILNPKWGNAQGQLLGFLAYDLVLIVPFINHFVTVRPEMRLSLV
ncbi:MAG: hypothetical protein ACRDIB_08795, partial [Ardenticatenaceae bacterium]